MNVNDNRTLLDETEIGSVVQNVLFHLHPIVESKQLDVETDLSLVTTLVDEELLYAAVDNLLHHAIEASPQNSELSISLIDGNFQWELEIADASSSASDLQKEPFIVGRHLVDAHRAALEMGGQIQRWNCPQGGIANVLVVPKRAAAKNPRRAV